MLVLDAGAGQAPYRKLFEHARYETADFTVPKGGGEPLTYVCDLAAIPVEDGRFDRVVLNQVLEHVPDPPAVVLRACSGSSVMTGGSSIPAPSSTSRTCSRMTTTGTPITRSAGCSRTPGSRSRSLSWVEGYFATVGLQFEQMHANLPRRMRGHGLGPIWLVAAPTMHLTRLAAFALAGFFYCFLTCAGRQTLARAFQRTTS